MIKLQYPKKQQYWALLYFFPSPVPHSFSTEIHRDHVPENLIYHNTVHRLTFLWGTEFLTQEVNHCSEWVSAASILAMVSSAGWSETPHSVILLNSYNSAVLQTWMTPPAYSWSMATWNMWKSLSYTVSPAYSGTVSTDDLKLPMYDLVNFFSSFRNSWKSPQDSQTPCSGNQSTHLSL